MNILAFHNNCVDGAVAAALIARYYPGFAEATLWSMDYDKYRDVALFELVSDLLIEEPVNLIFADYCPHNWQDFDALIGQAECRLMVTIYDHHPRVFEIPEKASMQVYRSKQDSGAYLVYQDIYANVTPSVEKLAPMVDMVSAYDTWTSLTPEVIGLNAYLLSRHDLNFIHNGNEISYELDDLVASLAYINPVELANYAKIFEHTMWSWAGDDITAYSSKIFTAKGPSKWRSEVARMLRNEHPGSVIIYLQQDKKGSASIRTDLDIDLNEVLRAADLEGGGHPQAVGCQVPTEEDLTRLIGTIKKEFDL